MQIKNKIRTKIRYLRDDYWTAKVVSYNQKEKDIARLKLQGVMNMIFICIIAFPLVILAELMKINKQLKREN